MNCRTLLPLLVLAGCAGQATDDASANVEVYRVSLAIPDSDLQIPFHLEVTDGVRAAVVNGQERIDVPDFAVESDGATWRLRFDLDSVLVLRREAPTNPEPRAIQTGEETTHRGLWTLNRGARGQTRMVAKAERVRLDVANPTQIKRFTPIQTIGSPRSNLQPRYAVDFSSSQDPAVATFDAPPGGLVNGTFRTTLGDYRYLAGDLAGDFLRLSCFDGHHAFLFHATIQDDGGMNGHFWSRDTWHETWTATPDVNADLPDTFGATTWSQTADPEAILCTALDGSPTDLGHVLDGGRPTVLIVFGSWCPNCHDATRLWANLHRRYQDEGLRVIGLAFELTDDTDKELKKLREFRERQGVDYDLFLCGLADKDAASEALPVLDRVRAYPTTIFLSEEGEAIAVHTGFDGPATGEPHQRLRARFDQLISDLLDS
ncbi:MAG: TlpA disulfide reductase family protein [Planctomycetota bacterium]